LPSRSPQGEGWFETALKKRLLTMRFVRGSARRHHRYCDVSATAADVVDLTIDSFLFGRRFDATVRRAGSARLTVWWQRYETVVVPSMWFSYAAGVSRKGRRSTEQREKHHSGDQFTHVVLPIQS
jgi:hypothetical protein